MNKNLWVIGSNLATRMGGQIVPVDDSKMIINFNVDGQLEKLTVDFDGQLYKMYTDTGVSFMLYEETMWEPSHMGQFLGMPTWYSVLSGVVAKTLKTGKSPRRLLTTKESRTGVPVRHRLPQHPLWKDVGINFNLDITPLNLPKFYIPVLGYRDGVITRLIGDGDFRPDKAEIDFDSNGKLFCYYRVSFGQLRSVLELTDRITRSTNFHSSEIARRGDEGEWVDNPAFKTASELLAAASDLKDAVEKYPSVKCWVSIWVPYRELGFGGKWQIIDLTNYLPEE